MKIGIDKTSYVAFELSNLCNYGHLHRKCPARGVGDKSAPQILPGVIVEDVLRNLGSAAYSQSISFAVHNDPLCDPRLFSFVELARECCPDACIVIGTNGWYLTTGLAEELFDAGATFFLVSAYSQYEQRRLEAIRSDLAAKVEYLPPRASFSINPTRTAFDDRMSMYYEGTPSPRPCNAPLTELVITSDGKLGLCCVDVWRKCIFGDLKAQSFGQVMESAAPQLERLRDELRKGQRTLPVCQRCTFVQRWWQAIDHGDRRWERALLSEMPR